MEASLLSQLDIPTVEHFITGLYEKNIVWSTGSKNSRKAWIGAVSATISLNNIEVGVKHLQINQLIDWGSPVWMRRPTGKITSKQPFQNDSCIISIGTVFLLIKVPSRIVAPTPEKNV